MEEGGSLSLYMNDLMEFGNLHGLGGRGGGMSFRV